MKMRTSATRTEMLQSGQTICWNQLRTVYYALMYELLTDNQLIILYGKLIARFYNYPEEK